MLKKYFALLLLLSSSFAMATSPGNFLFLQTATSGTLVQNQDNSYTLTLNNLPQYVNYFSSRPERKAGIINLQEFINLWTDSKLKNNFSQDPPNAAIALKAKAKKAQSFVAIVSNPTYKGNSLSYKLKLISKQGIDTGSLAHITLFFDDIPWNPGGF